MMKLIIGGSGSGKSAYAENCVSELSGQIKKYYLATMQVFDEEGQKKISRHKELRRGKGFITIEQPVSIQEALKKMIKEEKAVLLECMSNLVANEMFTGKIPECESVATGMISENEVMVTDKIVNGIQVLKKELTHLVVVSNNVFEDGIAYDETTMEYIRALGNINERLSTMADEVVEIVAGIPILIKKGS